MNTGRDNADAEPLSAAWLNAIARLEVSAALEAVYRAASEAVEARGPACWASGRCCNFDRAGHRLYVTGLETAYTIARNVAASTSPATVATPRSSNSRAISLEVVQAARERGGCPFQVDNLCGVHAIKPLGCRVYFCDRSAQQWQQDLSERLLADIRAIHKQFTIDYRYGEWREMLAMFAPRAA